MRPNKCLTHLSRAGSRRGVWHPHQELSDLLQIPRACPPALQTCHAWTQCTFPLSIQGHYWARCTEHHTVFADRWSTITLRCSANVVMPPPSAICVSHTATCRHIWRLNVSSSDLTTSRWDKERTSGEMLFSPQVFNEDGQRTRHKEACLNQTKQGLCL